MRSKLIDCARAHAEARTPYEWEGGHHGSSFGLDCSGLILSCLRGIGVDPGPWDVEEFVALPVTTRPEPADLAIYDGHVVMVESFDPGTGIASIIGANGGDDTTTTLDQARKQNAYVRRESTHLYRDDFSGFRSIDGLLRDDTPWAAITVFSTGVAAMLYVVSR